MPKVYTATFLLGRQSPTEDIEGEVVELDHPPVPRFEDIQRAARALTGNILQRPPAYSALKVGGRRSYDLARRGHAVELKPRPVTVHQLQVVGYEYPELKLTVKCGAGTYVRSLGRDLAESLGTAAVMSALVRTAIGSFGLEEAVGPDQVSPENWESFLLPPLRAVEMLPQVRLTDDDATRIRAGQAIRRQIDSSQSEEWAAVDGGGRLVAVVVARGPGLLGPTRNLVD
jgi:tRNA pseudouridine55 synthase